MCDLLFRTNEDSFLTTINLPLDIINVILTYIPEYNCFNGKHSLVSSCYSNPIFFTITGIYGESINKHNNSKVTFFFHQMHHDDYFNFLRLSRLVLRCKLKGKNKTKIHRFRNCHLKHVKIKKKAFIDNTSLKCLQKQNQILLKTHLGTDTDFQIEFSNPQLTLHDFFLAFLIQSK